MTNPIPSAGETTIIGLPAINVLPITTTGGSTADSRGSGHHHQIVRGNGIADFRQGSGLRFSLLA